MIDWAAIEKATPPQTMGQEIFHVRVSEICPNGLQSICSLAEYLQEAAFRNSSMLNLGMESLRDTPLAWVLARLGLYVRHYPRNGDAVGVETWYAGIKGRFGQRFYRLRDENNMVIAAALTTFALFDLETRSVAEWPEYITNRIPEAGPLPLSFEQAKLESAKDGEAKPPITPRLGDIDLYNHVNNTKLIEWALSASSDGLKHPFQPKGIDILFRQECTAQDNACPKVKDLGEGRQNVLLSNDSGQELVRAQIIR